MNATVCTLFEGDYHLGAAALVNSLHASGFRGRIICGYRGELPAWSNQAIGRGADLSITFLPVDATFHLTYHKPQFMKLCLERSPPNHEAVFYFDPDIVVKAPWEVIARWARGGVALVEDINGYMPAHHPYRLAWTDFLKAHGMHVVRELDHYYNAGFIGVPHEAEGLLDRWAEINELALAQSQGKLKNDKPHALFHSADQDALNLALMTTYAPVNGAGPEAMDFTPGGHLLSHAVGGSKPWRAGFLRDSLRGRPPSRAARAFYDHVTAPVRIFSSAELWRRRFSLQCAAALGRVYRRT